MLYYAFIKKECTQKSRVKSKCREWSVSTFYLLLSTFDSRLLLLTLDLRLLDTLIEKSHFAQTTSQIEIHLNYRQNSTKFAHRSGGGCYAGIVNCYMHRWPKLVSGSYYLAFPLTPAHLAVGSGKWIANGKRLTKTFLTL